VADTDQSRTAPAQGAMPVRPAVADHGPMTTQPALTARLRLRRGLTVVAASTAALLGWAIAGPGLDLELAVRQGAGVTTIDAGSVLAASLLAGLAAWGLTALAERLTTQARPAWLATAGIVLALSLAGPLLGGLTVAATVALVLMHLVVGAILMVGLVPRR
jgi:hypothetical protein